MKKFVQFCAIVTLTLMFAVGNAANVPATTTQSCESTTCVKNCPNNKECNARQNCPNNKECNARQNCPNNKECNARQNCPNNKECNARQNCPNNKQNCYRAKNGPRGRGCPRR